MLKVAKDGEAYHVELFQVNRLNTLFSSLVEEQLGELLSQPGTEVVFNLRGVCFIDSSGFDVLGRISDLAARSGSSFSLCNVSEDVQELIRLLEMEGKFRYCTLKENAEKILMELD